MQKESARAAQSTPELIDPYFKIDWLHGALSLEGHTQSDVHERNLLDAAAAIYPGRAVQVHFKPYGFTPPQWEDSTVQLLYALAPTESARAHLEPNQLEVRSVTTTPVLWRNRMNALRHSLPGSIDIAEDTIIVVAAAARNACQSALSSFRAGAIGFEESTSTLLASAYPRLSRVASIAASCPDATVTVTGHTDSSGTALLNRRLSLQRAEVVAAFLESLGVSNERLRVAGAGSSLPIADNATRYGRGLNRRIEIEFDGY